MNIQPMLGDLAWAPLPSFGQLDVLDRFNGVPTLGTFGNPGEKVLFWRALGYVPPDELSVWLYVPLAADDERHLEDAESGMLLHGLVFASSSGRRVTIGVARDYRLFVDFGWDLPANISADGLMSKMLAFLESSLSRLAEQESAAPARREAARRAYSTVHELAVC